MEDNSDVDSDGSNIDIGNFDENDDFELREVNRNADKWLETMFDSDSDNDMEFEGKVIIFLIKMFKHEFCLPSVEGGSFCTLVWCICLFHSPIFSINHHTRAVHNNDGPLLPLGVEPLHPRSI
jgi:hypothetical protein